MSLKSFTTTLIRELIPWHGYEHTIRQSPTGICFSLDAPRYLKPRAKDTLLRGWCFAEGSQRIQAVRIHYRGQTQLARYGIERHDVIEAFGKTDPVLYSGFEVPLTVPSGATPFRLEAQTEDDQWHLLIEEFLIRPRLRCIDPHHQKGKKHPYQQWIRQYDSFSNEDNRAIASHIQRFEHKPLISIVVPAYNTPPPLLDKMVRSVLAQSYSNWELCITDDHSPSARSRKRLQYWTRKDKRIRVGFRPQNGHISACSNTGIAMARGPYIALLDHDDELAKHALYFVVNEINRHPDAPIIYSDEDKLDPDGFRIDPYFKPDFGIDLLRSHNFVSHFGVYRTDLLREIKGFREDRVGSQDWDLVLRCLEHIDTDKIRHIPRVLYHWRMTSESTSANVGNKNYAVVAGENALKDHLTKAEPGAEVLDGPAMGAFRIRYPITHPTKVSILIPTRDSADLLSTCVDSILTHTDYPDYEIRILDNGSQEPATLDLFDRYSNHPRIHIDKHPGPFNFSAINNAAAKVASGEVLLFLNNDMEVKDGDWLRELVSHALRPGVGPVGAKLLFPDGYVQHAGVVLGMGGIAAHAFKYLHHLNPGHIGRAGIIQNYSAVTAACMAIRKDRFLELGGFDEEHLGVAYNDIDFCLRAGEAGLRTVFTPYACLIHHESASRGLENNDAKKQRWEAESDIMKQRWAKYIANDPFYNPALTLLKEDFSLAAPPRYSKPWQDEPKN